MIHETTLAFEYADKPAEWSFQRVTTVRESCQSKARVRIALRNLMPGYKARINDIQVKRSAALGRKDCYVIGDERLTFEQAIEVLERKRSVRAAIRPYQLELPLVIEDAA